MTALLKSNIPRQVAKNTKNLRQCKLTTVIHLHEIVLTSIYGRLSGCHFVAHLLHHLRRGSNEAQVVVQTRLCKVWPLRQETIAGVNGVHFILLRNKKSLVMPSFYYTFAFYRIFSLQQWILGFRVNSWIFGHECKLLISPVQEKKMKFRITKPYLCYSDDFWNTEISVHRRESLADDVRLVCLLSVHVHLVLFTVHSNGPDAKFCACSENSDSDFTWKLRKCSWMLKKKGFLFNQNLTFHVETPFLQSKFRLSKIKEIS